MPDIFSLVAKWWKQIAVIVLGALVVVAIIVFSQPSKYLSTATAVPANAALADKGRLFNNNIEALYPPLGGPDDLDRIIGTAQLDTIYLALGSSFRLWEHYAVKEKGQLALYKAASILKANTRVAKSEYGELKVKVWDTNKQMAADLANAILDQLNTLHQHLQNETNQATLNSLLVQKNKLLREADSGQLAATNAVSSVQRQVLLDQLVAYEKQIHEFEVATSMPTPVLLVTERARPSAHPDKPRRAMILTATAFLALLFALALALIQERRKTGMP